MDAKYTPGPWRWTSVDGGWDGVCEESSPQSIICTLSLNNEANARLIARAPDLVDCLQALLDATDPFCINTGEPFERCREVLASARGG